MIRIVILAIVLISVLGFIFFSNTTTVLDVINSNLCLETIDRIDVEVYKQLMIQFLTVYQIKMKLIDFLIY
ncbi:hypothetical protein F8154_09595 [Alkaliphilus pronyensis]|uniref:Uncharacterized protein n=1 Tax=Alkaliphilus pronyensis TaxID=1482732 RepID=A0A6I0EYR6_9FIRM|nr:hypothetical protein [Alkaliphilus pronyensis]KAB3534080.1 hypothetical protein F8154_09595 [Alkaliphilus pronyensis]